MTKRLGAIASIALLGLMLLSSTFFQATNFFSGHGDSTIAAEIITNINKEGRANSQIAFSALEAIFEKRISARTAEEIASFDLSRKNDIDTNFMRYHFVPAYYIIAIAKVFFSAEIALGLATSLSFFGMLLIIFYNARKIAIPTLPALAITAVFTFHPAWGTSFSGQFYIDRMFICVGLWLAFTVSNANFRPWNFLLLSIASALIVEKTTLISGIFLVGYSLLFWKQNTKKQNSLTLTAGLTLIFFATLTIRFFLNNEYYGSFLSINHMTGFIPRLLNDPLFRSNVSTFSLLNILPLISLSWIDWRVALIPLILMGPNIFGDIGGAEKVNFATHYHSTYFPFLVWSISTLLFTLYRTRPRLTITSLPVLAAIWLLSTPPIGTSKIMAKIKENPIINVIKFGSKELAGHHNLEAARQLSTEFDDIIPHSTNVTTIEAFMPHLYQDRNLHIYPLGLENSDYVVLLRSTNSSGEISFGPFYSSLLGGTSPEIDKILTKRLKQHGYNVEHPHLIRGSIAVLSRKTEK